MFVCVQVLIDLVEDQLFKDSRKHRENRYRPVIRLIISLSTFENRGNPSNFQESGNTPVAIDRLDILQRESGITGRPIFKK